MPKIVLPQEVKHAFIKQLTDAYGGHNYLSEFAFKKRITPKDIKKFRSIYGYYDWEYDENIPKSLITKTMKKNGWRYKTHSVRAVYTRGNFVAKVAIDSAGIAQNFLEVKFYKERLNKIRKDKWKPDILHFPQLFEYDPNFIWLTVRKIEGKKPQTAEQKGYCKILSQYLITHKLEDINIHNILVSKKKSECKYYVIDCGFYRALDSTWDGML